jgi:acetoacetyl-CoA synthetase
MHLPFAELANETLASSPASPARGKTTSLLLQAARDVLQRPELDAEDSLVGYCQDLRKIIPIVRTVQAATGLELSITTFAQPLSIDAIGQALAAGNTASPLLINLRPGIGDPLFLIPGVAGAVVELIDLANAIGGTSPVYGLAFPGLDGKAPFRASLRQLAEDMQLQINAIASTGRVHLVGYSSGGRIAIEIARLLGPERTAFVGVIDAPVHFRHWPRALWMRYFMKRIASAPVHIKTSAAPVLSMKKQIATLPAPSQRHMMGRLRSRLRTLAAIAHQRYGDIRAPDYLDTFLYRVTNLPANLQAVRDGSLLAVALDPPTRYEGKVFCFNSTEGDGSMCEPVKIWPRFLPNVVFTKVPGGHASVILPPHVQFLGKAITASLLETIRS